VFNHPFYKGSRPITPMLRDLISKFNKSLAKSVVSFRKSYHAPIKVWFEPDRLTGRLIVTPESATGETTDLSKTGVAFLMSSIRIKEKYLVGQERILNAEIDLPSGKIRMQLLGKRYERVGQHISMEKFHIGAQIVNMTADNREAYEQFLRYAGRRKKGAESLGLELD
jgi:hypothetical protein